MSEVIWTKEYKIERYKKLNETVKKGQIVCAGSSLMEMFPIEQFIEEDGAAVTIYNRGVGGFVTEELLANVDTCILDLEPSKLFINIGTNDLSIAERSVDSIMDTYGKILSAVQKRLPNVEIFLMAYYPVNYDAAAEEIKPCLRIRTNEKIAMANERVAELAKAHHAHFIDINEPLKDAAGNLKAEYTIEGMHINEQGYRAIYPFFMNYI